MFQEYPKWIDIPDHEDGGKVVFSKEEEEEALRPTVPDPEPKKRGRPAKAK